MKRAFALTWWVARRELVDQLRDWRVLGPMIFLVIFFPYLMNVAAMASIDFVNQYGGNLIAERIVPLLLMVVGFFPVTVSLVVALEAFVGEKERGTLEPILSSPLEDWQMYLGKLTAGTLFPLVGSYLSIGLYLAGLTWQKIPWPPVDVLLQMLLLTAAQTVLMVSAAIIISTQSTSVRSANLLASFIVIPAALLIQGESALIFWGTNQVLWLAIVAVLIVAGLIIRLGLAHFQREALLGREIDVLSWGWARAVFLRRFTGGARNLTDWYTHMLTKTIVSMRFSLLVVFLVGLFSVFFAQGYLTGWLAGIQAPADVSKLMRGISKQLVPDAVESLNFLFLFGNNLRALVIMLFLGVFSFGVGGMGAYMLNFSLIGGVLSVVKWVGLSPLDIFLYGILPHGWAELSAIIFSTAAVMHIGLRLITPQRHANLGQTLLEGLADWLQIFLGLALPLLLMAALIETFITPILLLSVLKP